MYRQQAPHGPLIGGSSVIEGRYGVRIFAAEGLMAFHTITDHTPVTIAIRQFYCRRRIGSYLPELEQRDEWEFTTRRNVSAKRRDGYVNFGRAEYIFNVVTSNEIVLVIELLSRNRLVAWSEVMLDSLGDKVRRLRHPPVDIAGALRDLSLRSTTATIGIEVFRARWDMMGFDGGEEDEEEEAPPPPSRPKSEKPKSPEAPEVKESCQFAIDSVSGVPFNILTTRLAVHVSVEANDIGDPVSIAYQVASSPAQEPAFNTECTCQLTDSSCVVVVLEGIEMKKRVRVLLGHCVIPVRIGSTAGNYVTRIRRGEPNKQQLIPYEDDINDYLPCMFLKYRLDSDDKSASYKQKQPPTPNEADLEQDRHRYPMKSAAENKMSEEEAVRYFQAPIFRELFDTSFLTYYTANRGLMINIEGLRNLGKENAMYKVVLQVPNSRESIYWTKKNIMSSDVGAPKYDDGPMLFTNVPHDTHTCALFRVFKINVPTTTSGGKFEPVGFTVSKLFLDGNVLRNGRFLVPILEGNPPPEFLDELTEKPVEGVVIEWMSKVFGKLKFMKHSAILVAQGDPLREAELTQKYVTKPPPKPILVPEKQKDKFPIHERAGDAGVLLDAVLKENPEEVLRAMNTKMAQLPGLPR